MNRNQVILTTADWLDVEDAVANALAFIEKLGYKSGNVHDDLQSAHMTLLMLHATLSKSEVKRYIFAD